MLAQRNLASSFLPITSLQPQRFHAITHSFAQRRQPIRFPYNDLRTLLPLTAISFFASSLPHSPLATRHFSLVFPITCRLFVVSLPSFSDSRPLFSTACSLFSQNTGGWGIPNAPTGHPG